MKYLYYFLFVLLAILAGVNTLALVKHSTNTPPLVGAFAVITCFFWSLAFFFKARKLS